MVNTFLIDEDFRQSAKRLNWQRLGKQRVEAYQILIALNQLRFLAKHFGIPDYPVDQDTPKSERLDWINTVLNTFKSSGLASIHVKPNLVIEIPHGYPLPIKPKSGNQLLYDPDQQKIYEVKGKRQTVVSSGSIHDYVLPDDELITTGFRKHPAVCMWLGFETALKAYINAHIEEWVEREYNNTMKIHDVPNNYARPSWTRDLNVINNFKCTLVERELDRNEALWYSLQPDMVRCYTQNEAQFNQFQTILSQRSPLEPKLDSYGQPILNEKGEMVMCEPADYTEMKKVLHGLGSFPGFIWP